MEENVGQISVGCMCPLGMCLHRLKMDLRKKIVDFFQEKGILVQAETVEFLMKRGNGIKTCEEILKNFEEYPLILSLDLVKNFFRGKDNRKEVKKEVKKERPIEEGFKILRDITGNSTCKGEIKDFVCLFRDRYERLSELLKKRQEMRYAFPIKKALRRTDEIAFIGIVKEVSNSKNGIFAEIEDYEDSIEVYIPKDVDSFVVNDEILGIKGKKSGNLFIAKSVVRPDLPVGRRRNFSEESTHVLFLSDLHVGSKSFLEKEWNNFIEWINGRRGSERQREIAKKIEYIIISGDDVEGIGIYPGQEYDLLIEDIYMQYEELARKLSEIPEKIKIILQPGNHDAVRPALPQPAFEKEIRKFFSGLNISFIGNPCYFEINGVIILAYHGQSIQDFATCLPGMNQNNPTQIMKEMLKRRHMAPIYGSISSFAPEKKDYLVIDYVPDIFVTGHVHVTSIETYREVLLINASAWQMQTEYQRMMNFMPDPAKAVIVDLKNMFSTIIHFT